MKRHRADHDYDSHPALEKIHELYHDLLNHNGFGELRMEVRILKRGQKEIIVHCGKQYRFVVDAPEVPAEGKASLPRPRRSRQRKEVLGEN